MPNAFMLLPQKNYTHKEHSPKVDQLQGLEPASERDTERDQLRYPSGRCSHGILPLQGFHLGLAGPSKGPPLMGL